MRQNITQERESDREPPPTMVVANIDEGRAHSFLPWPWERERENGENVLFTFKPKQPNLNRHEPATQPIHTKAQIAM